MTVDERIEALLKANPTWTRAEAREQAELDEAVEAGTAELVWETCRAFATRGHVCDHASVSPAAED